MDAGRRRNDGGRRDRRRGRLERRVRPAAGHRRGARPARVTADGHGRLRPTLFDERFGLAARRPDALEPLPKFADDALDPARSDGDLCIQACADDPQVAVHAVRNLARLAHGIAAVRFSQLGFGRTSSTTRAQATPRNLFGFKDGTANLKAEDAAAMRQHVWVAPGDDAKAAWMVDGSYLVARRIRMTIETWDRDSLGDQEQVIGRHKRSGAPFSNQDEFATLDLAAKGPDGGPLVPAQSHVRLAHPDTNGGAKLLRRGYSFVDGSDDARAPRGGPVLPRLPARSARTVRPHPAALAGKHNDAMNEYITHVASGLYAIPPGVRRPAIGGGARCSIPRLSMYTRAHAHRPVARTSGSLAARGARGGAWPWL